jgi:3',5'-cyclic-AMP phosphodiesterase
MYGDFDHSFQLGGNKFIFLNTNFLEFDENIPRLDWLENELKDTASFRNAFVVSHVPPNDVDFNPDKELDYARIVRNGKVRLSIHGHRHNYEFRQFYEDGLDYLVIGSSGKRYYEIVTVVGKKVTFEKISF